MAMEPPGKNLLIFEYNGSARSGKGTIVSYLSKKSSHIAVEETGVDYRAITRSLILSGSINTKMSDQEISAKLDSLGHEPLSEIVAGRSALLAEHGTDSLYSSDVNELVATVGKVELARKAVKAGFIKRVEAVRDKGDHQILLVDGRDLAKVLKDVPGTSLVLRTFVTCSELEAARRECLRSGIDPHSAAGRFVLAAIEKRTQADAMRQLDPVKPDQDALDYWHPPGSVDKNDLGRQAVIDAKQIYFDTTAFGKLTDSKQAMCEAAEQMFNSALAAT